MCLPATFLVMLSKWQPSALKNLALTDFELASFYFADATILLLILDPWFHQKLNRGCMYGIPFGTPHEIDPKKKKSCEPTQEEIMLTGIHHWNCLDKHSAKLFEK